MSESTPENVPTADTAPLPVPEPQAPEPPATAYVPAAAPEPSAAQAPAHRRLSTSAWIAIGVAGALLFGVVAFGAGWGARSVTLHFGGPRGMVASQQFGQGAQQFDGPGGQGYGRPDSDGTAQGQDGQGYGRGNGYGQGRGMMPRGQMPGHPWDQGDSGTREGGGWDR